MSDSAGQSLPGFARLVKLQSPFLRVGCHTQRPTFNPEYHGH